MGWLLSNWTILAIDVSNYGMREWLAIIGSMVGIAGSIYGAWRTYRYSKSQIAKRLIEHLTDDEKAIKQVRNLVVRHIRYGVPLPKEPDHAFYDMLKDVLRQIGRGESDLAERRLNAFAETLVGDAAVGRKYTSNANLQTATVYLLLGKLAKDRAEITPARSAWTTALHHFDKDAEAARYLGELALANGAADDAWEHFAKAVDLAPDDKLLQAETSELRARYYRERGNPKLELGALSQCAPAFADAGAHEKAAFNFARAGEIASDLGQNVQAPRLMRQAFGNYDRAGDPDGMRAVRDKLESWGDDVGDLPAVEQRFRRHLPWTWIRLALELSILATAAVLFYFTLR